MNREKSIFIFMLVFICLSFIEVPSGTAATDNRPDLHISNFWIWPKDPSSRSWFDIRVRVYNSGNTTPNKNVLLHLYIGGGATPIAFNLGQIQPGKSVTREKRVLLERAGQYIARAVVDPENKINEKREDNNTRQLKFKVKKASSQEYLPELEAAVYKQEPKEPCTDDTIQFRGSITNKGVVKAPASVAVFLIGGATPIRIDVPPLDPNQDKSITFSQNIPAAGKYTVKVIADYDGKIKEYSEKNNTDSLKFEVFANCCVDYAISNFWIWPKNPKAGESFDIRMRVYNYGKKKAKESTTVSLYVGGSTVPYTFDLPPLPPGKEWTHYHTVSLNKKGKYTARIIADNPKKIPECSKDNNARSMNFNVK